MCRADLPPGPQQLFGDKRRLYFALSQVVERNGSSSWSELPAAQQRTMDEVFRDWGGAEEQGHAKAQCNMGAVFRDGQGAPKS